MKASDIRFAGSDPRWLEIAEALEVPLETLDAHTLAAAATEAIAARGLPPIDASRSLFLDLWRANDSTTAHDPPPESTPLERDMRRRLVELAEAIGHWRIRLGTRPAYASPRAKYAHGLTKVFRELAKNEGENAASIKHWAMTTPDALRLIEAMRPVAVVQRPKKPRNSAQPLGDAGAALAETWR
jgi:hypothetical protein